MSYSRENPKVSASVEDKVNEMRGYKATLSNPNTSNEAKDHAQDVLSNELGGNKAQQELYDARGRSKDPNRVAGGLKAAQTNRRVTEQGKKSSAEKLDHMPQE